MAVDIRLRSGLLIQDAAAKLIAKFEVWPWGLYDGVTPSEPNRVTSIDLNQANRLRARFSRNAFDLMIQHCGLSIESTLREIPLHLALEDADLSALHGHIVPLFDGLLKTKGVKLAAATKLLHPFRPKLIPVLDLVLDHYYWYSTSIRDEARFHQLQKASWGEYVFGLLELLQEDINGARAQIDEVLRHCASKPFANVSRVRALESLIWHYYVGKPVPPTTDPS